MRLWSIQSKDVYDAICQNGIYRRLTNDIDEWLKSSYDWMVKQMVARIGGASFDYPVWAWTTRPDLRRERFSYGNHDEEMVLLEIEIDNNKILLSDFDGFNLVINGMLGIDRGVSAKEMAEIFLGEEYGEDWSEKYDESWSEEYAQTALDTLWENIFNVEDSEYVQATFWEIRKDDVKSIKGFVSKTRL